jgi:WD40 repeat protein
MLVTMDFDDYMSVWELHEGGEAVRKRVIESNHTNFVGIALSPDDRYIAMNDGSVWDSDSGQKVHELRGSEGGKLCGDSVAWSPDGEFIVACHGEYLSLCHVCQVDTVP